MIKHFIMVGAFALMPGIIFGAALAEFKGKSVAQALYLCSEEPSYDYWYHNNGDCDEAYEDVQHYSEEDIYQTDDSWEAEEEHCPVDQDYNNILPFDPYEEEEYHYNAYYQYCDEQSSDEYWYEENCSYVIPATKLSYSKVFDECDFSRAARDQKREVDFKQDRSYHAKYIDALAHYQLEKPGKKAKRAAYEKATKDNLNCSISIRKARHLASENSPSRRHDKISKLLKLSFKQVKKRAEREQRAAEREAKRDASALEIMQKNVTNPGDETISWQDASSAVLFEKRLHDAHRHYRAPLTKSKAKTAKAPPKQFYGKSKKTFVQPALDRTKNCQPQIKFFQ